MKRKTAAWGRPHAQASTRLGRKPLAFILSLVLCLGLLPGAALAEGEGSAAVSYGLWLGGTEITSANANSIFEDGGEAVVHYSLAEPQNPEAGGTLYIETNVWFAEDHEGGVAPATIYAKYPLTIQLNGGLTVSTDNESEPAVKVGTGNIYCEDTLMVRGSDTTIYNQDYDLVVSGSVSAKSVTLEYAHLRSNAGSVTAKDGDITLTGSCLKAWHGDFTDNTCVSAAKGAIFAENAKIGDKTECYEGETKQEGFVSGTTNCLKNGTFNAILDNRPEQVEAPMIIPDDMGQSVTFMGTQEVYLFCNTDGAEIHYTLNGSEPTKESAQYTGPIIIDKNCVVKAIAVKEGMADSDVVTSDTFTKVTGIDEPSIRFSPDGKAYPANDTIPFDYSSNEYEYVLVPNYGAADDYANVNVSGKVAVVQRGGNITFADKYKNAKTKGAAGLIIYNNQSGKFGAGLGDMSEDEKTIPLISTTREAGLAALHNTKDNIHGTLWIDPQQPGFKAKFCNLRDLTGKGKLLTGRVNFTALCSEGDAVTMNNGVVLDYAYTGNVPNDYWIELEKFDHWSCNDPNVSLTETPETILNPQAYDRLITIPDHDIQLIANWTDETLPAPHYKITFNLNYESAPASVEAVTGTDGKLAALLHDPVRSGYLFEGWYTAQAGGEKVSVDRVYTEPTTLYAHWTRIGSSDGGSSSGGSSSSPTYSITAPDKTENGSVTVDAKSAKRGSSVTITITPDKGYTLETLTVLDKDGKEISVTKKSDTQYTFTMPSGRVEVKTRFMEDNSMLNYFVDVKASDSYYDAVLWAAEKGITSGTDAVHFSPSAPCTRAQIVTFLWRAAGSPVVNYAMDLSDVAGDAYYAEAVRWALSEGITTGTSDHTFSPDAVCTREQAVTFLYRAAGSPAVSGESAFEDVGADAYYARAVAWAAQNGVTNGISQVLFGSGNDCTRAQIVTFLYRAAQNQ